MLHLIATLGPVLHQLGPMLHGFIACPTFTRPGGGWFPHPLILNSCFNVR